MKKTLSLAVIMFFSLLLIAKSAYAAAIDPGTSSGTIKEQLKFDLLRSVGAMLGLGGEDETKNPSPSSVPQPSSVPHGTIYPTQPLPSNVSSNPNTSYPSSYVSEARKCLKNRSAYQLASSYTGVPWQIMAGIHYVEGNCGANKSCVSGRTLGVNEPDLYGNCTLQGGVGKPVPIGGGCGFRTLSDSCIYAANHLKGKIGKVPSTIQDLAKALGRYNGIGNANCDRVNASMPYCPARYEGFDHIYPFSKYDAIHQTMYLVYCADYTRCNPPKIFQRIGVLTIANILSNL